MRLASLAKRTGRTGALLPLLALLAGGCEAGSTPPEPAVGSAEATPLPAPMAPAQMPAELFDSGGIHWRKTRMAVVADDQGEGPGAAPAPAAAPAPSMAQLPTDQAAARLRPVMLFNGVEYEADWEDAMRIAASVQAAARARPRPPIEDDGASPPIRQAATLADTRMDISGQADAHPYINIAALVGWSQNQDDPRLRDARYCTCFKMNKVTCVTAAHCVANSWRKRHPSTFKTPPTIQFAAAAGGSALPMIDPNKTPYSIVIPRGYWLPNLDDGALISMDFAVIRFRGAYTDPPELKDGYTPWNGPPKQIVPDVPFALYDTGEPGSLILSDQIADVAGQIVAVAGYPGDKYPALSYAEGPLDRPGDSPRLSYSLGSGGGESGSPVLTWDSLTPEPKVIGIHYGVGIPGRKGGPRLTSVVLGWIRAVRGI